LRGIEGARVKKIYEKLAKHHGLEWSRRNYDVNDWAKADDVNRCISVATSCLYGVTEAAVLAAGYAPSIGFIHTGKPLSFVYDIADIIKYLEVMPLAFEKAAQFKKRGYVKPLELERTVRIACRDLFRQKKIVQRLIPLIEDVLAAGELDPPKTPEGVVPQAIPEPPSIGDAGHRSA